MSLEILEAKEAIREVIDRFSNLECDVHAQKNLFTDDVHIMVHMGGKLAMDIHGSDEMEKQFSAFTASVKASHHMNGQQVIEINGDTATDTHYCRATMIVADKEGKESISEAYIRYVDTLVKKGDKWLISVRDQYFLISESRKIE